MQQGTEHRQHKNLMYCLKRAIANLGQNGHDYDCKERDAGMNRAT